MPKNEKTVQDVVDSMSKEQKIAMNFMVQKALEENISKVIHSIVTSYDYNRSDAHLLRVIKNVISRFKDKGPTAYNFHEDVREDADIFTGILVNLYGDYGTSPRYGWLDKDKKDTVMKALKDEFESELQDTKTCVEYMPDRYTEEELKELKSLIKALED